MADARTVVEAGAIPTEQLAAALLDHDLSFHWCDTRRALDAYLQRDCKIRDYELEFRESSGAGAAVVVKRRQEST